MRSPALTSFATASLVAALLGSTPTPALAFLDFFKKNTQQKAPGGSELQAQEAAASALLAEAQSASSVGKSNDIYDQILKKYPFTNTAAEAAYGKALNMRQNASIKEAFNAFQVLVNNYRQSPRFSDAVQQQYEIAEEAKGGKKVRSVILVPMKLGPNEVIGLYKQVISNAPFGKFAPLSQFSIAEIHQDQGEKAEAIAAYQAVVDNYPSSKEAAEAQFRIGAISNIAAKKTEDSSNLIASRDALKTYVTTNPSGDRASEAQNLLNQIDVDEANRSLIIGKFYEKSGKPKAAAIYYNEALKYGTPEVSEEARARLAEVSATNPEAVSDVKKANPSSDYTVPAAVDLKGRSDYAGPPAPELARLSQKPKMRKDGDSFAPIPLTEPTLPTGPGANNTPAGSLLPPVGGDKPALLPVPAAPPVPPLPNKDGVGIPLQPEPIPAPPVPPAPEKTSN